MIFGHGLRAELLRHGAGSAAIQALNRVLGLALGIILARGLGVRGYGIYAYAFAIMSLLTVAGEAGVPWLLTREVAASLARERWGLLRGAVTRGRQLVLVVSTIISAIGLVVLWRLVGRVSAETIWTTGIMLLVLPLATLAKTAAAVMRGLHQAVVGQAVDLLLRPALALLAVGGMFLVFPGLRYPQYAMTAQLGAAFIVVIVGIWALGRLLPDQARTAEAEYRTREWLKSAVPFLVIGGAGIINNQTDIIMLGWFRDAREVGIYRVATQGGVFVSFFLQAATAVLAPHFARMYASRDIARLRQLYRKSTLLIFLASLPVALILVTAGERLIFVIFGSAYSDAALPLAILAGGYLVNGVFGPVGLLLLMVGRERVTARLLWLSAILNIVLNLALIPRYGAAGGALSTAFTVALYHAMLRYRVRRDVGF